MQEKTAEEIWSVPEGQTRKPRGAHLVISALFIGIGTVVGSAGISFNIGFGVTFFWPGIAIQIVGGIWYGVWGGGIAAGLFPVFTNAITGGAPIVVSLLWVPANVIQGMLTGWFFRRFKLDPRLTRWRDWLAVIVVGGIITNIPGALWGPFIGRLFGMFTDQAYWFAVTAWMIGNGVCAMILVPFLLKSLSHIVIRTRTFCKGWLA